MNNNKLYCQKTPKLYGQYFDVGEWYEVAESKVNPGFYYVISKGLKFLYDESDFLTVEEYKVMLVKKRYEI